MIFRFSKKEIEVFPAHRVLAVIKVKVDFRDQMVNQDHPAYLDHLVSKVNLDYLDHLDKWEYPELGVRKVTRDNPASLDYLDRKAWMAYLVSLDEMVKKVMPALEFLGKADHQVFLDKKGIEQRPANLVYLEKKEIWVSLESEEKKVLLELVVYQEHRDFRDRKENRALMEHQEKMDFLVLRDHPALKVQLDHVEMMAYLEFLVLTA